MKFKKIVFIFMINFIVISNICYGKYVYYWEETIVEFIRDSSLPICHVSYSESEVTNQNVVVTIEVNKEIEPVSGFLLSEDKKILTKEVCKNECKEIKIRDLSGNYVEVEYNVNNIDKEPPQIIGVENGAICNAPVTLNFLDNQEIESIKIDQYSYDLSIIGCRDLENTSNLTVYIDEHPLGSRKYRYYVNEKLYSTVPDLNYTFINLKENAQIKVEALDELGNVLDEVVLEKIVNYYEEKEVEGVENELTQSGDYQVVATDTAGNMTVYYIKIK